MATLDSLQRVKPVSVHFVGVVVTNGRHPENKQITKYN